MTLYLSISTMCLSTNLAVALVASSLVPLARAQNSAGSDAPGAPVGSTGNPAAQNAAGASGGEGGGLSKQNQIIIGVVVGVVALVAIAGGVYYFVRKKRQWDERKKRYKAIHSHRSEASRRQHEMSAVRQQSRRRGRDVEQGKRPEITTVPKDEARSSQYPKYDPSTYRHHHQHSSLDSSHAMTSLDLPGQSSTSHHQRSSSQSSGVVPPAPPAASNREVFDVSPIQDDSSPSDTSSPTPMVKAPSSRWKGSLRTPKKPKPVLTRLVTNL